jgi:SOS-response transcriptional repressor LexA
MVEDYCISNLSAPQPLLNPCIYGFSHSRLTSRVKNAYENRRDNLRQLIAELAGGSQAAFAQIMGWEQASLVSRLLSDNTRTRQNIGDKMARTIETKCQKPANWLDHPNRDSLTVTREPGTDYNTTEGPSLGRRVPLISWVQAGQWQDLIDNLMPGQAESWHHATVAVGPRAYALRIVGDSMTNPTGTPSFPEGTIIILDPDIEAQPGKFVVVRQNGHTECTFKKLVTDSGRYFLKPLNPAYPMLEMRSDAVICGVLRQAFMTFD